MNELQLAKLYLEKIKNKMELANSRQALPIIIDCDPGIDDAMALLYIYENLNNFDVLLLTSCAGNTPIDITTENLKFFAENFFDGVVVAKGSAYPLVSTKKMNADDVHGKNGLGGFNIGTPQYDIEDNAVDCLARTLEQCSQPLTIVALGPLTNIAKLVINYPELKSKIKNIYTMIGSTDGTGNVTDYAEFNSYFDPEAFDIVSKCNIPLIINPMQAGNITKIEKLDFQDMPESTIKHKMIKELASNIFEPENNDYICVYDIHTVISMVQPDLYDFINCNIEIYTDPKVGGKTKFQPNPNGIHCFIQPKNTNDIKAHILENLFRK